jgi:hypothetical protein
MDAEFNDQGIFENISTNSNLANKDAFFRNRVSEPFTIFDSQNRYRDNGKFSYAIGGSGSYTYLTNESAIRLTVTGNLGDYVYRESKRVMAYQPGKSLLIMMTFAFSNPVSGLRQRVGYFGTNNGIYLEHDGTGLFLVLRSYVTGSVDNSRKVAQSDWNGHKFNGSTFYQRNLDVTKANIFWMDVEWLGVGDVRCGFIVDGVPVVAHVFHNDNLNSTTYMTTAVLPIRQEIENTGNTGVSSNMRVICSTVISEGGYQGRAITNHSATTIVANDYKTLSTPGSFYPMISMKLKSTRLDAVVLPTQIDLIAATNDNLQWKLVLNPTIVGTTSFTDYSTDSSIQIDVAGTTFTGGTVIAGGIVYQKSETNLGGIENFNFQLGRSIQGTSDILTLAVSGSANTAKCVAGLGWTELI